jgi:hypothetical protein
MHMFAYILHLHDFFPYFFENFSIFILLFIKGTCTPMFTESAPSKIDFKYDDIVEITYLWI